MADLHLRRVVKRAADLWLHRAGAEAAAGDVMHGALRGAGLFAGTRQADVNRTGATTGAGGLSGVRQVDVSRAGGLGADGQLAGSSQLVFRDPGAAQGTIAGEGSLSGTGELVGDTPIVVTSSPPKSPPAWSSIGRPTPRRPRRQTARRLVVTTTQLTVESQSHVLARVFDSHVTDIASSSRVTCSSSCRSTMQAVVAIARLQSLARSECRTHVAEVRRPDTATRRDSAATEELLLLGLF
jgi:hypothetical protein